MDSAGFRLLQVLDSLLAEGAPHRLHLGGARPARRAPGDAPTIIEAWPRLLVGVDGEHRYVCSHAGERAEAPLPRGHALHLAPGAWSIPARRAACRFFAVVFRPHTLRVLIAEYAAGGGRPSIVWHHTRAPLGGAGAHALAALDALAEGAPGHDAAPMQFAALLRLVRAHLVADLERPADEPAGRTHWRAASRIIAERHAEPIGRAEIARLVGIHPHHLAEVFHAHGGTTLRDALRDARVATARRLLRATDLTLAEVARRSGLGDAGHLVKLIRRAHGTTPGRLRRGAM